jgi:hypothetical protein
MGFEVMVDMSWRGHLRGKAKRSHHCFLQQGRGTEKHLMREVREG